MQASNKILAPNQRLYRLMTISTRTTNASGSYVIYGRMLKTTRCIIRAHICSISSTVKCHVINVSIFALFFTAGFLHRPSVKEHIIYSFYEIVPGFSRWFRTRPNCQRKDAGLPVNDRRAVVRAPRRRKKLQRGHTAANVLFPLWATYFSVVDRVDVALAELRLHGRLEGQRGKLTEARDSVRRHSATDGGSTDPTVAGQTRLIIDVAGAATSKNVHIIWNNNSSRIN